FKMLRFLIFLGLGLALILGALSDCNVCSSVTNVACVSNTSFQFCSTDLVPTGSIYTCPTGYYCTANSVICEANAAFRSCVGCGLCNTDSIFACLSANTFALCLGTTTPSQIVGSCGTNYVCDWSNPEICGTVATGSQATCPGTSDGIPGVDPTTMTPTEFCNIVQQNGRFPYGVDLTTTCRQYIYCHVNAGVWSGALYDCPGQTYFNSTARLCGTGVPPRCSTGYPTSCWSSGSGSCSGTTITNANEYCRSLGTAGRYPYGGLTATTCKQYVTCYSVDGVFYGNIYSCPASTYFDSTTQLCTTKTQARCSDTVQCLTLNDRLLP
ncbi:hypothetical protein KR018_009097, partial [Drosophila ironensis]